MEKSVERRKCGFFQNFSNEIVLTKRKSYIKLTFCERTTLQRRET